MDSDHEHGIGGAGVNDNGRRPMNAFLLFCKRHRGIVKEKYPNLENRNITKILGEWWQSLDDNEKSHFNQLASEYKDHVMREQPNFRWRRQPGSGNTPIKSHHQGQLPNGHSSLEVKQVSASSTTRNSSSSSSPEPSKCSSSQSSVSGGPTAAPKPFKKRFLESITSEAVSPEAEHACKALLQLAGVRESSPAARAPTSTSSNGSRSGTSSPPEDKRRLQSSASGGTGGFRTLRDAVWSRVAKTLLTQEEEKGKGTGADDDAPLNLSSQCTIRGQTIIEHIIENILDKPVVEGSEEQAMALNLNNNGTNGGGGSDSNGEGDSVQASVAAAASASSASTEDLKARIYEGLKKDLLSKRTGDKKDIRDASALWNLLPHISNSKDSKSSSAPEVSTKDNNDLSIKHLLAQSPAPVSPKSKSSVSVTLVTEEKPVNLSTTPPSQLSPSKSEAKTQMSGGVTITATLAKEGAGDTEEEEEDEVRRSARSCKGRRYQEFKDEGRLGRSRSGGSSSSTERPSNTRTRSHHKSGGGGGGDSGDDTTRRLSESSSSTNHHHSRSSSSNTHQAEPPTPFDITAKLNAIPALSLDEYQQKVIKAKSGGGGGGGGSSVSTRSTRSSSSSSNSMHHHQQQQLHQQRRRSSDHLDVPGGTGSKRKTRRMGTTASGENKKKEEEALAASVTS